ncbi:hypothetical protein JCM5296_000539, partial [Sporobolomyces johnsonii]
AKGGVDQGNTMRLRPPAGSTVIVLVLLLFVTSAHASTGDLSPAYQRCLESCFSSQCSAAPSPSTDAEISPFSSYSSSPLWPCPSTCRYACQQHLTALSLAYPPLSPHVSSLSSPGGALEGLPLGEQVQFHGKWPFHRLDLSGLPLPLRWIDYLLPRAQEPLSVVFSLGNLWAHYQGFLTLRRLSRTGHTPEGRRLAKVYELYAWSGLGAWVWSAVFHTRDTDWTERLDYFGAALTGLVGLWSAVVRQRGWYAPPPRNNKLPTRRLVPLAWTGVVAVVFALHCAYLGLRPRFDYTYNMRFNVAVALATITLWLRWTTAQARLPAPSNFSRRQLSAYPSARARFRAPHYRKPLAPLVALPALTLLEVLDFPPVGLGTGLRLLDAHAVWHASTIPVVGWWYGFLATDVRWIDGQGVVEPSAERERPSATSETKKDRPEGEESGEGTVRRGSLLGLGILGGYGIGLGRKGSRVLGLLDGDLKGGDRREGDRGGGGQKGRRKE